MSRTIHNRTRDFMIRHFCGRSRGIAKAKRKLTRRIRHIQDAVTRRSDDPVVEQPNRYYNFWWEWL
jgi:hypothetical protein